MSTRTSVRQLVTLIFSGFLLICGCNDQLKSESLIQETRVLGARLEVAGDALRGSPGPGEGAHFSLFVAAPNGAANVAYAFSICGVAPTNAGFPDCMTAPFAGVLQADPTTAVPALDFEVPADLDVNQVPHGFARGIVCPDSAAALSASGEAQCAGGPDDAFAFEFDLAGPGQDNENPTFVADSLTLDGAAWLAIDAGTECASLAQVAVNSTHSLGVALRAQDFDTLVQTNAEDPTRETLLLSQFATTGELAHTFVSLTPSTPGLSSAVNWSAPSQADAGGTIAHFYFVVRDSRGGEDLAERAVCVTP